VQGGNPALVPEEAKTWTVGAVITPERFPNWQVAVDYFQLEVTDSIGSIDAMAICFDPANVSNLYCENIRRDAANGNISEVFQPQDNRGLNSTEGVDTQINFESELPATLALFEGFAQLTVDMTWTHTFENRSQLNPVTQIVDCAGFFGWFCGLRISEGSGSTLPKNRITTHVNYGSGPLGIHLTSRWIDGTTNAALLEPNFFGPAPPVLAIPGIGSKHYLDLGLAYTFRDRATIRAGVVNLTDTDPPNMADAAFANNTDSFLYDVFGRSYYLSLSARLFD
jgi:outer membrane receptor protein involved in Fe transport